MDRDVMVQRISRTTKGHNILDNFIKSITTLKPTVSNALFHYCRAPTLGKLFADNGEIYCTHIGALDDDREILEGCKIFLQYLIEKCEFSPQLVGFLQANLEHNLNDFDPTGNNLGRMIPWSFSMSEVDDSPYQWKHYTDCIRGGYQIAFSRSKLEAAIDSVNEANTQSMIKANQKQILLLLPCFYIGVDDVAIQQIFSAIMDDFRAEFEDVKNGNLSNQRSGRSVLASIFLCSAIIKRNCFRHEHEWRIIVIATPEISSQFETTVGKPCLRTFLSSSISGGGIKDLIAEVKCSPQGNIVELTRNANCRQLYYTDKLSTCV